MKSTSLYRAIIILLIVSTLTCNLVMVTFLTRFFYGDLKVENPASLYRVTSSLGSRGQLSYPDYRDILERVDAIDQLAAVMPKRGAPAFIGEDVYWLDAAWATGSFPSVIGSAGLVGGRMFTPDDDQADAGKVALVNQSTWDKFHPGEPFDFGEQIYVKSTPFEIVGVVENEFPYLDSLAEIEVWLPARQNPDSWEYQIDDYQEYQLLARADPDKRAVADHQISAALEGMEKRLGYAYTASLLSESEFRIRQNSGMHRLFIALLAVTVLLFCLGIVNQLLMLVTRSVAIGADLKIMVALGAQSKHVLSRFARGFAAVLGVALAGVVLSTLAILQIYNALWGGDYGAIPLARLFEPIPIALMLAMTAILLALHLGFPLLMYFLRGENLVVRDRAAGSRFSIKHKLSLAGVSLQIAIVAMTVLGSGAFLESLRTEGSVKAGRFDSQLVMVEIALASKNVENSPRFRARLDALKAGLIDLGGIEAVSLSSALPLHQGGWARALREGVPPEKEPEWIAFNFVSPDYFETVGLDFLKGRNATADEAVGWPHQNFVVNQAFVDKYYPTEEPVGRRIAPWESDGGLRPIVGVVENELMSLDGDEPPCIYIPTYQERGILTIRLSDPSLIYSHLEAIEARIRSVDAEAIIVNLDTVESIWSDALASSRLGFYILVFLSAIGLALSMSGAFGYQTYMMLLREREFAIRHSLGQPGKEIYWTEIKRGMKMAASGLALGFVAFFASIRLFGAYFFNAELSLATAILAAIALSGAFLLVLALASSASTRPKLATLMRE